MRRRPPRQPPPRLVPFLLLAAALLSALGARLSQAQPQALPTTGPSPYLIAPPPPTGTLSAGDLSSSQPYWRDPNRVAAPFPGGGGRGGAQGGPRQGVGPGPVGGTNGTGPPLSPGASPPPAPPPSGTSPGNGSAAPEGPSDSTLTRGVQLLLPAAGRSRGLPSSADPFSSMALGVAGALLPPLLAAKAAELASAAAAKVFAKKAAAASCGGGKKRKATGKSSCPLSPADRDLLRTAAGAALGAGAGALAESATPLELARCAVTLKETKPAAFQWVLFSAGRVNPCSIVLGEVSQAIAAGIVEGKCFVPPVSTAVTSAAAVGT